MTQPAAVFGMDRSADPLVELRSAAVVVARPEVVLGCMVDWLCVVDGCMVAVLRVVAGGMVDWLCAVVVRCVVAADWVVDWLASACWPSVV